MASSSSTSPLRNTPSHIQAAGFFDFQFSNSDPKPIAEVVHHHPLHHHYPPQPRHHQTPPPLHGLDGPSVAIAPPGVYMGKDYGGAYNFNDLDQAMGLFGLDGAISEIPGGPSVLRDEMMKESSGMRPPTLNIFPSQPMHVAPSPSSAKASAGLVSTSPSSSGSKRSSEPSMELAPNPASRLVEVGQPSKAVKVEGNRRAGASSGVTSEQEGPKTPDPKTLRRLAQNREAARKSRLRKKAYVQQLENSRIRLTQLEQELQRARAQGLFVGGSGLLGGEQSSGHGNLNSAVAVFDMEYARWLDDHTHLINEMRNVLNSHVPEQELRQNVQNCLQHINMLMALKSEVAKTDVFHLLSGNWKTPAERCFMWLGGFRPSQVIKVIMSQIEPLTEQQLLAMCSLQQQTQEAEEVMSQGLENLNQSLSDIICSDALGFSEHIGGGFMNHAALAVNRLGSIEGFIRQADALRYQMLERLQQVLTVRQSARCLLAIAEYFSRLRALSAYWIARPRVE